MADQHAHHILFAGGGTQGRLTPGLAVAHRLQNENPHVQITFFGDGNAPEQRRVEKAGFRYITGKCRPLPIRFWQVPGYWATEIAARTAARRMLRDQAVRVVVGLGGHASVPVAGAAKQLGLPVVLLEQNVVPGRANRRLAGSATVICTAFAETQHHLASHLPTRWTGNPVPPGAVRRLLLQKTRPHDSRLEPSPWSDEETPTPLIAHRQLLILGSSGGSESLNLSVAKALVRVRPRLIGWRVIHQTGAADQAAARAVYCRFDMPVQVAPLLADVPSLLVRSDLAVTRAGGTTLAQVAAATVPAILVPYPSSSDDHQRRNADIFAAAGAAAVLDERHAGKSLEERLARALWRLLGDSTARGNMAEALRRLAMPDATAHVAALVYSLAANGNTSPKPQTFTTTR